MLRRGHHFQVAAVVSLQSADKGRTHDSTQIRVFTIRFRRASPTGVTCHVHRRRPERKQVAELVFLVAPLFQLVPARAGPIRYNRCHLQLQPWIPCSSQSDGLRKHGEASRTYNPVQSLIAMIILRYAQTRYTGRRCTQKTDFLFHHQPRQQVHYAVVHWCSLVLIQLTLLGGNTASRHRKQHNECKSLKCSHNTCLRLTF